MTTPEEQMTPLAPLGDADADAERLRGGVFFLGAFGGVILVGLLAAMITWIFHPEPPPPCVSNCPPPTVEDLGVKSHGGPALTEANVFKSSALGFSVEYPDQWKVQDSNDSGVVLQTRAGLLWVLGSRGDTTPLAQLIPNQLRRFNQQVFPDIAQVGKIRGADIGTQEGQGTLYKATFFPPSGGGQSIVVRIGIIGARRSGLTIVAIALLPYDANSGSIAGAGEVDYALTAFRWPGEQ